MRLVVDIVIVANATAALIGFMWRRRKNTRRLHSPDYDHVKQLHEENREIDEMLADMKGEHDGGRDARHERR